MCLFDQGMTLVRAKSSHCRVNSAQEDVFLFLQILPLAPLLSGSLSERKQENKKQCGSVFQLSVVTWQEGWASSWMTHLYSCLSKKAPPIGFSITASWWECKQSCKSPGCFFCSLNSLTSLLHVKHLRMDKRWAHHTMSLSSYHCRRRQINALFDYMKPLLSRWLSKFGSSLFVQQWVSCLMFRLCGRDNLTTLSVFSQGSNLL